MTRTLYIVLDKGFPSRWGKPSGTPEGARESAEKELQGLYPDPAEATADNAYEQLSVVKITVEAYSEESLRNALKWVGRQDL